MPGDLSPCCATADPTCVPTPEHVLRYPLSPRHFHCSSVSAEYWLQFTMPSNANILISAYGQKNIQLLTSALKLLVNVRHYNTATFSSFDAQFCFRLKPPAFV